MRYNFNKSRKKIFKKFRIHVPPRYQLSATTITSYQIPMREKEELPKICLALKMRLCSSVDSSVQQVSESMGSNIVKSWIFAGFFSVMQNSQSTCEDRFLA